MKKIMTAIFLVVCMLSLASCSDMTRPIGVSGVLDGLGDSSGDSSGGGSSGGSSSGGGSSGSWTPSYDISGVTDILTESIWEQFFPERWYVGSFWKEWMSVQSFYTSDMDVDVYSYKNFAEAVNYLKNIQFKIVSELYNAKKIYRRDISQSQEWTFISESDAWSFDNSEEIIDFGQFINKDGEDDVSKKRELCAFLANISHETGEQIDGEYQGLFWREEVYYQSTPDIEHLAYRQEGNTLYPPSDGQSYHGRGPIQLSWNYNYGLVSDIIFGDKNYLLDNPDIVMEDGMVAFMTAIWFWMYPQYSKPSCHEVMYDDFEASSGQQSQWGFGHTIMIINGAMESSDTIARRNAFYTKYKTLLNVPDDATENLDTSGMYPY